MHVFLLKHSNSKFKYNLNKLPNIILLFALSLVKVYEDKIKIGLNYSINTTEEHEPIKNYVFAETK